jgi:hypothetical protein
MPKAHKNGRYESKKKKMAILKDSKVSNNDINGPTKPISNLNERFIKTNNPFTNFKADINQIHLLGNPRKLNKNEIHVLCLGSKFVPAQNGIITDTLNEFRKFTRRILLKYQFEYTESDNNQKTNLSVSNPLYKPSYKPSQDQQNYLDNVEEKLKNKFKQQRKSQLCIFPKILQKAINSLQNDPNLIIKETDKNQGFAVMTKNGIMIKCYLIYQNFNLILLSALLLLLCFYSNLYKIYYCNTTIYITQ